MVAGNKTPNVLSLVCMFSPLGLTPHQAGELSTSILCGLEMEHRSLNSTTSRSAEWGRWVG